MNKLSWNTRRIEEFQKDLLTWYEQEKRLLPWRENTSAYPIWVSEIMLQQTQVVTVIPYFLRFMEWFPTIEALAEADETRLLKAWEGLGYYSRVRNMQIAAQQIVADFDGQMPKTIEEISSLKGIGPYTAGAIGSISFDLVEPAIDGNLMRVYSRLFSIAEDIAKVKTRKTFDYYVRTTMSESHPGDFNQALMDLGSRICTPKAPKCEDCPLQAYCQAYAEGTTANFPVKLKKIKATPCYYLALAIKNEKEEYLLSRRAETGLLAKMWTFPLVEVTKEEYLSFKKTSEGQEDTSQASLWDSLVAEASPSELKTPYLKRLQQEFPAVIWQLSALGEVVHLFSHRKWHILVSYGILPTLQLQNTVENEAWIHPENFKNYNFPKAQEKMLNLLNQTKKLT
ncbi:A/G-specific adenine glycosylase [Vagococcus sp.]|uniref:A/G-specific adenine glycosylase n=1 Tax=Vagococcus sp. TaxID=1933889 RepID=UPI003F9AE5CC